jgi:excisionase family DNA binding protein
LTVKDAANYVGRTQQWIERAVARRETPNYQIGGSSRIWTSS